MILNILILVILILLNGVLSASELAFLSIEKFELDKMIRKRKKNAKKIRKILEDPSNFLSTIQVGITLAGFLSSAFAASTFVDKIMKTGFVIINPNFTSGFLMVVITIVLSYFTLVFGELVPKKIALSNPFKVASFSVNLINVMQVIFFPLIKLLSLSTNLICKILKIEEKEEDFTEEDGIRASELEGEFAEMNGWEAESDAATLLNGLGIETDLHYSQMADLTGSQKVKVLLAQALFGNPDILLLDEPTNHLDLPAIEWLEEFLINFDNTVIVVSHDRYFLNKVCTHTADIDYGKIQLYAGNYDFWFESSQLLIKQMKEANKKKEEKIKELQEFISRFSANASKSKQATSRKRALEKIQLDDMRPSSRKYPYIDFRPNREIGNEVLMVENLSKTIDGVKVLDNISFTLGHDDKVAFVGANEQAITTLFKILVGEMEPDEGNYKWGVTTSQAYFPKDNTAEFDNDLTITDWLTQYSEIKDATYVRGFLGRMLFPGEDGIKRVRVLSGGEKVRCLLSKMMISGANILILDEPTNHLDMESITALNNGLIKFPGVILFTSHDHQFVQTTANRIMEILPNGTMIDKITTYDEYLASDEMAKKRHVFEINEEDASDN